MSDRINAIFKNAFNENGELCFTNRFCETLSLSPKFHVNKSMLDENKEETEKFKMLVENKIHKPIPNINLQLAAELLILPILNDDEEEEEENEETEEILNAQENGKNLRRTKTKKDEQLDVCSKNSRRESQKGKPKRKQPKKHSFIIPFNQIFSPTIIPFKEETRYGISFKVFIFFFVESHVYY